jgi:hypothetical protein
MQPVYCDVTALVIFLLNKTSCLATILDQGAKMNMMHFILNFQYLTHNYNLLSDSKQTHIILIPFFRLKTHTEE